MSVDGIVTFTKTILLPILIALFLYLILFHALIPLYRHHRARYAQYLPLNTLPQSLQPSSLRSGLSTSLFRVFLPSTWSLHNSHNQAARRLSTISDEADTPSDRFSDEHGEAMVGFDLAANRGGVNRDSSSTTPRAANITNTSPPSNPPGVARSLLVEHNRRRRDGMDQQVSRNILAAREMNATSPTVAFDEPPPERRLSRELEEVFRDDSDDEDDEDNDVTVGRRSISISRP